jgi:hypothetical protein
LVPSAEARESHETKESAGFHLPDERTHRGPDPRDGRAFAPAAWPALRAAVADLAWLLERGYAPVSALKLVGDRWSLTERQRMAVLRSTCSDTARGRRLRQEVGAEGIRGRPLVIDGFNVLTTIEAALGGAVLVLGRDGAVRDLAGVHGTYRKVEETLPALGLVGTLLAELGVAHGLWLLDRPVSNSGRLKGLLLEAAAAHHWTWDVELPFNPDPLLIATAEIVATADSVVLDQCAHWFNLARAVVERCIPTAHVVDLASES